jgi:hypothetical protein
VINGVTNFSSRTKPPNTRLTYCAAAAVGLRSVSGEDPVWGGVAADRCTAIIMIASEKKGSMHFAFIQDAQSESKRVNKRCKRCVCCSVAWIRSAPRPSHFNMVPRIGLMKIDKNLSLYRFSMRGVERSAE